jgi:hypothetical protein
VISLTTAWYVWPVLVATVFMFGALAGQWDANRLMRRRLRFNRSCPDCRHYGSTCDGCATPSGGTDP